MKPEKARAVEDRLIQMARGGAIRGKVDETALKGMLESLDKASDAGRTKITFKRRGMDSDEEEDDDDWM